MNTKLAEAKTNKLVIPG